MIRRRTCVMGGLVAAASPPRLAAAVSATKMHRIGVLDPDPEGFTDLWKEFVDELRRRGYHEGRNITFERRFGSELQQQRLAKLAAELVALKVDVIYAAHGSQSAQAAMKATKSIPVVFFSSGDPVGLGLVASLSSPGGNLTGNSLASFETYPKSLQLLQEVVGKLDRVIEISPEGTRALPWFSQMEAATAATARRLGVRYDYVEAASMSEIRAALERAIREGVHAVAVGGSGWIKPHLREIAATLVQRRLPSIGAPQEGFLLEYEADFLQLARKSAGYVDKILKGARPADLPVEQPSAFNLTINGKTARAIGLKIPDSVLMRATKIIQE
jgi:putative ABC transport system substrate-binding protein